MRTIKEKGLRKLRYGRAKSEILEKLEVVESSIYRTGKANYDSHNFTSTVEYIAIRRAELEQGYQERMKLIESVFAERKSMFASV